MVWDGLGVVVKRTEPHRILLISDNVHHKSYEMTIGEAQIIGRISTILSVI